MAKVIMTIDTEEQTCAVTIDGEKVSNVAEVSCYNYGSHDKPEYYARVTTVEESGEGVRKVTNYMAAKAAEAQAALKDGTGTVSKKFKGFVVKAGVSSVMEDVIKYFAK